MSDKGRLTPEKEAEQLFNLIYSDVKSFHKSHGDNLAMNSLRTSVEVCKLIKNNVPMYMGEINPVWLHWDEVEKCLTKKLY